MDFGCGTGSASPYFFDLLGAQSVIGIDTSARSLDVARRNHIGRQSRFSLMDDYLPEEAIDLAFCNGVFHHIPVEERGAGSRLYLPFAQTGRLVCNVGK